MLVNVVDVPPLCNFIMPAIARVGPISIAVSTRGASPALAKRLRTEIAERYGEPYAQLAELLNGVRTWAGETLPTYQDCVLRVHRARRPIRSSCCSGRRAGRARADRRPYPGRREQWRTGLRVSRLHRGRGAAPVRRGVLHPRGRSGLEHPAGRSAVAPPDRLSRGWPARHAGDRGSRGGLAASPSRPSAAGRLGAAAGRHEPRPEGWADSPGRSCTARSSVRPERRHGALERRPGASTDPASA